MASLNVASAPHRDPDPEASAPHMGPVVCFAHGGPGKGQRRERGCRTEPPVRLDGRWEQKRGAYKRTDRRDTYRLHWVFPRWSSDQQGSSKLSALSGRAESGASSLCAATRPLRSARGTFPLSPGSRRGFFFAGQIWRVGMKAGSLPLVHLCCDSRTRRANGG